MGTLSRLLFFAKIFVVFGGGLALIVRAITTEAMPWWPDTGIFAVYLGSFAVLVAFTHSIDRRRWRHLFNVGRLTRVWWKTRNTV